MTTLSATDAWAVGGYNNNMVNTNLTLIEHWNGASWAVTPSPNVTFSGQSNDSLSAVGAISSNDIWAVGSFGYPNGFGQALAEHWNGAQWSVVNTPPVSSTVPVGNGFASVAGVASNDVWAVGSYRTSNASQPLIEHWDGTQWSIVANPNVVTGSLSSVVALASNNVWAVGFMQRQALVEHWDGSTWSVIPTPHVPADSYAFDSVAAVSANDIWAVGTEINNRLPDPQLIEQWNGTQWSVVNASTQSGLVPLSVTSVPGTQEVWSAGYYDVGKYTLTQWYTQGSWQIVPSVSVDSGAAPNDELNGISAVSSTNVWAVGGVTYPDGTYQAVIEHFAPRYG